MLTNQWTETMQYKRMAQYCSTTVWETDKFIHKTMASSYTLNHGCA